MKKISAIVKFLVAAAAVILTACSDRTAEQQKSPGVAVLLVDANRTGRDIHENIYGQFLEHINHSVVDGLFAEQIRGSGFEGHDVENYWDLFGENGDAQLVSTKFERGENSIRLTARDGTAGIRQGRLYLQKDLLYDGYVWIKPEEGSPQSVLRLSDAEGSLMHEVPLRTSGTEWQQAAYAFTASKTDTAATVEIVVTGNGSVLVDFFSLMRADVRKNGMLRPDLLESLRGLRPTFLRWPGGSFASIYKWKDGVGPQWSRVYHPNDIWGGYSDYYGFGTDEYLELCRQLGTEPFIVLSATNTDSTQVEDAMDWVHYLNDPETTTWGRRRAANGHPQPYNVKYFQIDNEPMNHGLSAEQYAEIVNVYGSRLRTIAPNAKIVACGQKRSNDMEWSEKLIDLAGENFDVLGCHNYEYENENFQTGVMRIRDYLIKARDYIRTSDHPQISLAVLEWGLCRTYDWRAGLHAAGSLITYEALGPELDMTCPALLMRNTTDDPEWTAFIYHDHVSWFPGGGYVAEKLFREHYAGKYLASTSGTFRDINDRELFFNVISQMKPEDWTPGAVDAIATKSAEGDRIVIKAVNYEGNQNVLLARVEGFSPPQGASVRTYTLSAGLTDTPDLQHPDRIQVKEDSMPFSKDMEIVLEPYSVVVIEIGEGN